MGPAPLDISAVAVNKDRVQSMAVSLSAAFCVTSLADRTRNWNCILNSRPEYNQANKFDLN
jgi:hypothetical protein